jgi:streptogrisin C
VASARLVDTSTTALFAAMQRDLGLTREQAVRRFADEKAATDLAAALEPRLGAGFGGAWFDEATGRLAVAVTSTPAADEARNAGAVPRMVRHSLSELQAVKDELDDTQRAAPDGMADAISWGVDPQQNALVVTVRAGRTVEPVTKLASRRGDMVRVEESDVVPRTTAYLDGGDRMGVSPYTSHDDCSVGFNVYDSAKSYVLTAGHCGDVGNKAYSSSQPIGHYVQSWFPGDDDALVRFDYPAKWTQGPWVATYSADDSAYLVRGTIVNIVNGSACKSGMTTKITCGTIKRFGETVTYVGGDTVYGMTRHTACVKSGDSGGSNFTSPSGDGRVSALGVTSGSDAHLVNGVERCQHELGKTNSSWFQPIAESLSFYKVKLYTA